MIVLLDFSVVSNLLHSFTLLAILDARFQQANTEIFTSSPGSASKHENNDYIFLLISSFDLALL